MARLTGDHPDHVDPSVQPGLTQPQREDPTEEKFEGDERRVFLQAIPMLLVMMTVTACAGGLVVLAGLHGPLLDHGIMWLVGIPTLTVFAVAAAGEAVRGAALSDRNTHAARSLLYGMVAGLGTGFIGFAVMMFLARTAY